MSVFLALAGGLSALAAAYAGNVLIWRIFRGRGTAGLVPVWEESTKAAAGLLTGQLLTIHVIFGLGEAVLELRRRDRMAALLALVSHALCGLIASWCRNITGSWPAGWLLASVVHICWNLCVLRFSMR